MGARGRPRPTSEGELRTRKSHRIRLVPGDITVLEVDAIVNAANERLAPGGGVCGAIHRAAGPGLEAECARLRGCRPGEVRITGGYDLPARYVIHAVGPVWHGGARHEEATLASCYRTSLDCARRHGLRSLAFPAISTGIYGYPVERAAGVAVATVVSWLETEPDFDLVVFSVFGPEAEAAHRRALEASL